MWLPILSSCLIMISSANLNVKLPNIIFFLADDLGRYNLGYQGNSEARTPNIDALVSDGLILDRHYVFKFCSPTRSSFLSGRLPYHVSQKNSELPDINGVDLHMTTIAEKLQHAGYATHQVGKWHAGSTGVAQLPINRGFNSSFGYLSGEEDHFTQIEHGYLDLWEDYGPAYNNVSRYGAYMYAQRAVDIIHNHNTNIPLFLYQAWQEAHTPNEVPDEWTSKKIDFPLRRTYEGMVHCLDSGIKNVTQALKDKNMWDNTLVVFSSDNGGREDGKFGGNNYPLRGMKFSDFEGGTRVAGWVSGGFLPEARRGKKESGLIHIADWYSTFCHLAGVNPNNTASSVPNIDSINMWPTIKSGAVSPRNTQPLILSDDAIIMWPYKLVLGKQGGKGWWTGPKHPNGTKVSNSDAGCSNKGCVFDIDADEGEHNDLAKEKPDIQKNLLSVLNDALKTKFQTNYAPGTTPPPGNTNCTSIKDWAKKHKNFAGPICYPKKN